MRILFKLNAMLFNRSIWKKLSFDTDRIPPWPCSRCGHPLRFEKKYFQCLLSDDLPGSIVNLDEQEVPNIEYLEYRFSGILVCDGCKLKTTIAGYAHDLDRTKSPVSSEYYDRKERRLFPIHFNPPLRIFSIPKVCSVEITNQLSNAFGHYWNDRSSCANRIRVVLEMLMDELGINKKLILHKRIDKLRETNKTHGDFLEAVKWIGNTGSHGGHLSKIDILNGFELLDSVLNEIYPDELKKNRLIATSGKINVNKGPKS